MATNSEKFENLLNLALDATGKEREKSLQLGVGYEPEGERWELIVKYSGNIMRLAEENPQIQVTELMNEYAILNAPENAMIQISNAPEVEYVEKPKRLYFAVREGKQASCISSGPHCCQLMTKFNPHGSESRALTEDSRHLCPRAKNQTSDAGQKQRLLIRKGKLWIFTWHTPR